jgi:nucleotide-binding universal stress UspA family protein
METKRWIVVGTDFSDPARHALEIAVTMAADIGANVACVHAYEDTPGVRIVEDPTSKLSAELEETIVASGARSKGVHVEPIIRRGPPWEKLANVAADLGAGLIVVGASGQRWTPKQFFLGSVTSRLTATSKRLVLVVPSPCYCTFSLKHAATAS